MDRQVDEDPCRGCRAVDVRLRPAVLQPPRRGLLHRRRGLTVTHGGGHAPRWHVGLLVPLRGEAVPLRVAWHGDAGVSQLPVGAPPDGRPQRDPREGRRQVLPSPATHAIAGERMYQTVLVPKRVFQTLRGAEPLFQTLLGFPTVSETFFLLPPPKARSDFLASTCKN